MTVSYLTTLLQAVYKYLVPILSPANDKLLFLNQPKRENIYYERICVKSGTLPTELPCLVLYRMNIQLWG